MKEYVRMYVDRLSPYVFYWRPLYFMMAVFESVIGALSRGRPVTAFPAIDSGSGHMIYRLSYYFPESRVEYMGVDPKSVSRPDFLAPDIQVSSRLVQVTWLKVFFALISLSPVLVWDSRSLMARLVLWFPNAINCCNYTNDKEGWNYFRLMARLYGVRKHHYDFRTQTFKGKALAMGTGPSIDMMQDRACDQYDVIICNTIVKNLEFCRQLDPRFVVFADAVYHYGPSIYAHAFREALRVFLGEFPRCVVLIPELFSRHLAMLIPEYADRIYSIPFASDRTWSLDYREKYVVHRIDNILNQILAPLAATIAKDISFVGFDGRKSTDKGFWSHSAKNNFVDLLESQKDAHPSFFYKKNLGLYAVRQAQNTETIFQLLEAKGKTVRSLNESSNDAMNKRYVP